MTPMRNSLDREIPKIVEGYKEVVPFAGVRMPEELEHDHPVKHTRQSSGPIEIFDSLGDALRKTGIRDGMTISFHHHFRNGDHVINAVVEELRKLGVRDIRIASSGIFPCHEPLVAAMKDGTLTGVETNYVTGPVADAISRGHLRTPAIFRTHGGRARAIESGELHIDIAFIAASAVDEKGNLNGIDGPSACGSLGYAYPDAAYADTVVAVTDNLVKDKLSSIGIDGKFVDCIVVQDRIGDPVGIISGTTEPTNDATRLKIARSASRVIEASGFLIDGFSFQTGAGGTSMAVAQFVGKMMKERGIQGSCGLGGITSYFVEMLESGLFRQLMDVQCFDLETIASLKRNKNHIEIGASEYAHPHFKGSAVSMVDVAVLSAIEIDTNFNVNVTTKSTGEIMGGSGGHSDAAAGSTLSIIVAPLTRKQFPIVMDSVTTVTTPGESIDVLVTDAGIAVNPTNKDLKKKLIGASLPVVEIEELRDLAAKKCGPRKPPAWKERIVAIQEYCDGSVIDVIREI